MSAKRSDARRLIDLTKPWENGPRTPVIDTTGVPEWVTSSYNDDPRGLAIAVGRYRAGHSTVEEREVSRAFARSPRVPVYLCVQCSRHAFANPRVTCFWCRRYGVTRA